MLLILIRFPLLKDLKMQLFQLSYNFVKQIFAMKTLCVFTEVFYITRTKNEVLRRICLHQLKRFLRKNFIFCRTLATLQIFKFINKQTRSISDFS